MFANLPKFLRPSPFKAGLATSLLACYLGVFAGGEVEKAKVSFNERVTDEMFWIRGRRPTTDKVAIVDLDEKSLKELGQWPWPRTIVAKLLRKIAANGATVIGLDVVFAEPDRTSPRFFVERLKQAGWGEGLKSLENLPDHDAELGQAVAETPTILGYVFQLNNDGLRDEAEVPMPTANIETVPPGASVELMPQAYRPIINCPAISANPKSEGFFNADTESAGMVRKVPLFFAYAPLASDVDERRKPRLLLYPSLALEMLRLGLGEDRLVLDLNLSGEHAGQASGVIIGKKFIPTYYNASIIVNFRGPEKSFPYYCAADVLSDRLPEGIFKDKYILVGTSAKGLLDLRATPFSEVFPGVEVHANIIDNILAGDPLWSNPGIDIYWGLGVILGGGALISLTLARVGARTGALVGIFFLLLATAGNYYYFFLLKNQIVGVVAPVVGVLAVFIVVAGYSYFSEGQQKRFVKGAFGRYVSPHVVAELIKNPKLLSLEGEERELTIMFSDIRGFTTISEALGRGIAPFLNEYLSEMTDIVMAHDGTVDKFIGDAIMAFWGAPLQDPAHAAKAVRSCLAQIARLHELQVGWRARGLPEIDIGLGVNTGTVRVGNFGSYSRFDYTVIGDDVNLASRLEGTNKEYGTNIIISEATRKVIGDEFYCRTLDLVRVKGKKLPVKIFEPVCAGQPTSEQRASVETWEQALTAYWAQDFATADRQFAELHAAEPRKLYEIYRKRIALFREHPPAADWDGVYTFTTK